MKWIERLYFGTWQLGGQFKTLSPAHIESLLLFAISSGIRRFDTAAVYGNGNVEKVLGSCLPEYAVIVTKIPATSKPNMEKPAPIHDFYSQDIIYRSVYGSLERLQRTCIDTVLLHNWLPTWSTDAIIILQSLNRLRDQGVVKRVGISLPDNFLNHVDETVLQYIDVIEAPFNSEQKWVLQQLPYLLDMKKEILLRSLFRQGKELTEHNSAETIALKAFALGTSVVIGMTTKEQIRHNINNLKGISA